MPWEGDSVHWVHDNAEGAGLRDALACHLARRSVEERAYRSVDQLTMHSRFEDEVLELVHAPMEVETQKGDQRR